MMEIVEPALGQRAAMDVAVVRLGDAPGGSSETIYPFRSVLSVYQTFSASPQSYVTSVGEYLLTLPQQLEPLADGISNNDANNERSDVFLQLNGLFKVMELDSRVRRGRERLAQGDEPIAPPLLSAGQVDELNAEKALIQSQNDKVLVVPQEKKMALCEICGSFLVANDAAERTQSHDSGKQHIGYGLRVRDYITEYKESQGEGKGRGKD
ncbi:hypothetical protein NC651_009770 [Populus alba x Populus x berolinensis]|nr:hypothetical protein NC651_009770 [Populus alba x Populus x berolinensis]